MGLIVVASLLTAQFVITNPSGNPGTVSMGNDVVTCTDADMQLVFRMPDTVAYGANNQPGWNLETNFKDH
ncbi:MAG: hypothetical protein AB8H12_23665 [Lewinella sp.]